MALCHVRALRAGYLERSPFSRIGHARGWPYYGIWMWFRPSLAPSLAVREVSRYLVLQYQRADNGQRQHTGAILSLKDS